MDLVHAEKVKWNRNEAVRISKRHASGLNRELPQPIGRFRTSHAMTPIHLRRISHRLASAISVCS